MKQIHLPQLIVPFAFCVTLGARAAREDAPQKSSPKRGALPQGSELRILFVGNSLTAAKSKLKLAGRIVDVPEAQAKDLQSAAESVGDALSPKGKSR